MVYLTESLYNRLEVLLRRCVCRYWGFFSQFHTTTNLTHDDLKLRAPWGISLYMSQDTKNRVCSLIEVRKSEVIFSNWVHFYISISCIMLIIIITIISSSCGSLFAFKVNWVILLMKTKMCPDDGCKGHAVCYETFSLDTHLRAMKTEMVPVRGIPQVSKK